MWTLGSRVIAGDLNWLSIRNALRNRRQRQGIGATELLAEVAIRCRAVTKDLPRLKVPQRADGGTTVQPVTHVAVHEPTAGFRGLI